MPAPLAKGIVITVSVIIAAGIAVYENPQVQRWVYDSRRKIAIALHNLGDEIGPDQNHDQREDISMTEEMGEGAEMRRQRVREDLMRRASILEAKRRTTVGSSGSFDTLVDNEGKLKKQDEEIEPNDQMAQGKSTAVQSSWSGPVHRRPGDGVADISRSISDMAPNLSNEHRRAILESIDKDRVHLNAPSETASTHASESLVDLTPTSEVPDTTDMACGEEAPQEHSSTTEYFPAVSRRSSTHTEDAEPDFYYAHPFQPEQNATGISPWNNAGAGGDQHHFIPAPDVSSAPSIASDMSHIHNNPFDASSDGTISEASFARDGAHTPASWSEVGSDVSGDDGAHH